ncbi:hypothetical protein ACBQ19_16370, partial [Hafnia alvei]
SGLGVFADQLDNKVAISYQDLPGFPVSTVVGHAGELVLGSINRRLIMGMADGEVLVDGQVIYNASDLKVGLFKDTSAF